MKLPLRLTLRHMDASPALEELIRGRIEKLDAAYPLIRCAVTIDSPEHHARHGGVFTAHVSLTVPGAAIEITQEPHEDPYVAVRHAFDSAKRQLSERFGRRRAKRNE